MFSLPALFRDAMHLLYPHHCQGCGNDIIFKDQLLCILCLRRLPHTRFAMFAGNPAEKIFAGRIPIIAAHSEFYFAKGKLVQQLIHLLKYKGNQAIGELMGELMGETLLSSGRFAGIDMIIPLPMFPEKEFKRGYNQATVIGKGLAKCMNISLNNTSVTRSRLTETQTRKHRADRWENVAGSFIIHEPQTLYGKHILLIDDVVTTGATIEACAQSILNIQHTKISIASLAHATK